ncbi:MULTISPECIES: chaperone modulator CbpM [Variovorax]|jgi:chaperone modulatory protein CbpM|uniref:chaperone modulator CbpM n=1 Tax=Variovorax TaxID=34072 RepID=UPI00086A5F42|nr:MULTISPECIES: chaperone modulator CbpM [Variovorax]MBN8758120.1 MerR family transcriptional regulator [Variovorax sp.]ODU13050.1 MAG: MerR family transcriptional regulator [Variovorax sp. SCN 67-85]ODV16380.1 MAG: MerR family transcriptional regulator [Variovorax sp. SCN 67-20]OJZ07220.1 MAG: MerR family transcriptional regulator [Variovorax sp. 67-131]UKI11074.1 chaperone modulator CbpM [Variovorax paradoxus]
MVNFTLTTATAISASQPLAASDLAHAVGADTAWVVQLVEVGILRIETPETQPERWQFSSTDLQYALEARRLERDFGVGLDAAALILDLQHEVRRLKAVLHAHRLG